MRCHARRISAAVRAVRSQTCHGARRGVRHGARHDARHDALGVGGRGDVLRGNHGASGVCTECADWLATDSTPVSYVGRDQVFVVGVSSQNAWGRHRPHARRAPSV
jgi:hypothetical protein